MQIVHVASEAEPFAKTGGLADVLGALPPALARTGHSMTVVLPGYRTALERAPDARPVGGGIDVRGPLAWYRLEPLATERAGVRWVFLRCDELFDRSGLYGSRGRDFADNAIRFLAFARAAHSFASSVRADILHGHDWQAGLAVALAGTTRPRPDRPKTVFTIHNLAYQGRFDGRVFPFTGLPDDAAGVAGLEFYGEVSYLKGGLVYADRLTTVSPTYAREIETPEFGRGLEGVLSARAGRVQGILNGIDQHTWNPEHDRDLAHAFGPDRMEGRAEVKALLLAELGLDPDVRAPLLATVARLDPQKGFDLIVEAAPELVAAGARIAVLGTGEPALEGRIAELARRFPGRVCARLAFDARLAKRFYGGADLFLVPSRFEPCGLSQLYAMRYGAPPVVRRTGGLADTVSDADASPTGTGFVFDRATPEAFAEATKRGMAAWRDAERFRAIQRRGMLRDDSWDGPAREYIKLYEGLLGS